MIIISKSEHDPDILRNCHQPEPLEGAGKFGLSVSVSCFSLVVMLVLKYVCLLLFSSNVMCFSFETQFSSNVT